MNFSKIIDVVATVAPTIATALGGPLAGTAVGVLAKALMGKDSATPEELQLTLANPTADQLAAMKKAEYDFNAKMKELDIEVIRINEQDRDSARNREAQVHDITPSILAIGLTLGFFGLLTWLVGHSPPDGSRDLINIMLGSLGTGWISMLGYYFGSSAGSDAKNAIISKLTGK